MEELTALEQGFAEFVAEIEATAEYIFMFAITTGQPLPSKETIETRVKGWMEGVLESSVQAGIAKGRSIIEMELSRQIVSDRAQVAFQNKWAEIAQRHAAAISFDQSGAEVMQ